MEDPSPSPVDAEAISVSRWPAEHLRRAHQLSAAALRQAVLAGSPAQIRAAEEESLLFGDELLRRGLI
jgi:hypothetical protein